MQPIAANWHPLLTYCRLGRGRFAAVITNERFRRPACLDRMSARKPDAMVRAGCTSDHFGLNVVRKLQSATRPWWSFPTLMQAPDTELGSKRICRPSSATFRPFIPRFLGPDSRAGEHSFVLEEKQRQNFYVTDAHGLLIKLIPVCATTVKPSVGVDQCPARAIRMAE